jgi:hypothetical protein
MGIAHSNHCRYCKERIRELLLAIYGTCDVNRSFSWSALPQEYKGTCIGEVLREICTVLGTLRGHRDFIKSLQVPACDFYVSDPPFILEFDEFQHFSRPRLATLLVYPADLEFGFSVTRWRELCRELDAVDNEPFDRDERRAWYDTLRDLVPIIHGFRPTVRLYAGVFQWCSLDSQSTADQTRFTTMLPDSIKTQVEER